MLLATQMGSGAKSPHWDNDPWAISSHRAVEDAEETQEGLFAFPLPLSPRLRLYPRFFKSGSGPLFSIIGSAWDCGARTSVLESIGFGYNNKEEFMERVGP